MNQPVNKKKNLALAWVAFGLTGMAVLTACGGSDATAVTVKGTLGEGSTLDEVCAAGEKEGQLDYASSTDAEVFAEEIKPFQEKYPDIKINFSSQEPQDRVAAIVAKMQAKQAIGIDGITLDVPNVGPVIKLNLIADVDWKALGAADDELLTLDDTVLARTQRIVLGLGYNTDKITADELPNTWDDLLDPKWSGKFSVDPRGKYLAPLAITWGEDKAVEWYQKLLDNQPQLVQGATDSVQKVASGESLFTASSHDAEILEQQQAGAHVDIKYLDPVPAHDNYSVVFNRAKHPNAAACFLGWFISDEGQAQQLKYEFKGNETVPSGVPSGATVASDGDQQDADIETETSDKFAGMVADG
jgi:iron(III) transport system substrate-binding protein